MTAQKIAILVDSCSDVPEELRRKYGMYVVPMTKQIEADGYEKVIVVAISSGLSGTYEMLRSFGPGPEGLETCYVDTKSIGIGSGFSAIRAGELIEQGLPFAEVRREVESAARRTKLFFCVSTLSYLVKGGRIGHVAGLVGGIFDLKPVISCNEDGVYYTVAKTRGRKKSLQSALQKAVEYADGANEYNVAVMHGAAKQEADEILAAVKAQLPDFGLAIEGQITPVLVVHTGPGLIGIGIQRLAQEARSPSHVCRSESACGSISRPDAVPTAPGTVTTLA